MSGARPARRWPLLLLGALLLLPLLGGALLWGVLRADAIRPRLEAGVGSATGRAFSLAAPVSLRLGLAPTVVLEGPRLDGPEGLPPAFEAERAEATLALLPLLAGRVEVREARFLHPILRLDALAGPPPRPQPAAPGASRGGARRLAPALDRLILEEGRVERGGEVLLLPHLDLRDGPAGARAEGRAVLRGAGASLSGEAAPLAALLSGAPWPFRLAAEGEGWRAAAEGERGGAGWRATLSGSAGEAARLAGLLPEVPWRGARDLEARAEVSGAGLGAFRVWAGSASLEAWHPGLSLSDLSLSAEAAGAPLRAGGRARLAEAEAAFRLDLPPLDALLREAALPIEAWWDGEGVAVSASGTVPRSGLEGLSLRLHLRAADLGAFAARARLPLPPLTALAAEASLRGTEGTLRVEQALWDSGETAGRGEAVWRPERRLDLSLDLARLDLDALLAPRPATPGAAAAPAPPAPRGDGRLIPDRPLDLSALRDLPLPVSAGARAATLRWRGREWREASLAAVAEGGRLRLAPASARLGEGRLAGEAAADASGPLPALSLVLRGEAVEAAELLAIFLDRPVLSGRADLDLSLRGEGLGWRALAAGLSGHLGLALEDGRVEPALLEPVSDALSGALPASALAEGAALACFALRAEAEAGRARFTTLLLRTPLADATGEGGANLADETLSLRLRPVLRLGEAAVTTPLAVTGPLARPRVSLDPGAAAALLGGLGRREAAAPDCAPALVAARGEAASPAPDAPPAALRRQDALGELLRGLLRR